MRAETRRGFGARPARRSARWPWARRAGFALLLAVAAALLLRYAREVDWPAVAGVLRRYDAATLLPAAALAACSHALVAGYDLIGRHQVGHRLGRAQTLATAFVAYAFNLNLGALVGGLGMRYRLYTRLGLPLAQITQVIALSMATNWLGWLLLAGTALLFFPLALPPAWEVGSGALRALGALLLALAAAYLLVCARAKRRVRRLRGHAFRLPSSRLALLQLALSSANWMLMAGVIAVLMGGRVEYATLLAVLLIAAVAGMVTHVPAGLGVLEAMFVALLAHRVPHAELLGALLAYRAIYYLAPLGVAIAVYAALEARAGARS